eukprot:scaffold164202_cov17-Tisochrysis_lutea.AAC.1
MALPLAPALSANSRPQRGQAERPAQAEAVSALERGASTPPPPEQTAAAGPALVGGGRPHGQSPEKKSSELFTAEAPKYRNRCFR